MLRNLILLSYFVLAFVISVEKVTVLRIMVVIMTFIGKCPMILFMAVGRSSDRE